MDSSPEFTTPTEKEGEVIKQYHEVETEFMADTGFFTHSRNALIRSHAVSIIATHSKTDDSDAYIPYLAMNYFDRYFSRIQFQDVEDVASDAEKVCLIALSCLFLSAKMRTKTFSIDEFLRDKSINFTPKRIMEMELNILKVLHWRMRPVTAFLYLNYYYRYFKSLGFKRRCINEIIVQAQGENQFVSYKPSQIAMLAFLAATEIAYPSEIKQLPYEEEVLSECVRALVDLCGRKKIKIECGKSEAVNSSEEVEGEKSEEMPSDEELEVTEEEKRRLAKGKAVAVSEPSNKEKQRVTMGKEVAVSETSDEEPQRQPPKLKLGGEKKISYKEEHEEIVAGVATTIKVGIGMEKVKLDIVNELEKLMNFDLKWVIDVPSLEDGEPQTASSETPNVSAQISPITVHGEGSSNTTNKVGCANCSII